MTNPIADSISAALGQLAPTFQAINEDASLWGEIAKLYRNTLEALLAAGFSREEAVSIISRQGAFKA